jgi:excisionase family DNA binding protein
MIDYGSLTDMERRVMGLGPKPERQTHYLALDLYTTREVAEMFRVSSMTVYRWRDKGLLPCIKIGGTVRYRASDVKRLFDVG